MYIIFGCIEFCSQKSLKCRGDKQSNETEGSCELCAGTGEIIWPKLPCITCNGEKVVDKQKMLEIDINKGNKSNLSTILNDTSNVTDRVFAIISKLLKISK